MGRLLGAFDGEEIDRPDLNKCPDCGCFFAAEKCPLCGKVCPEEFRAGNRKPVKQKKKRGSSSSRTVTFIEWYHSWWVIILALIFFPIMGIILLLTSPHKKSLKIGIAAAAIIWGIISYSNLIGNIAGMFDKPVDTSLTQEEYVEICDKITAEEFYRSGDEYTDKFVTFKVVIEKRIVVPDAQYNGNKYSIYYVCHDDKGNEFEIIIRDCVQENLKNYLPGDVITIYGEGAGEITLYDYSGDYKEHTAPCINVAFIELVAHVEHIGDE